MSIRLFLAIAGTTYAALFACSGPPEEPAPTTTSTPIQYVPITTTSSTSTTTSTTSTTAPPTPIVFPETPCQEWAPTAVEAGWPADPFVLHKLLTIMWRESRCQPLATSRHEDTGLLQIHPNSWCRPNRYNEIGWLQAQGVITDCAELYDPLTNLRAARAIYLYSEARGDAWRPWALTR